MKREKSGFCSLFLSGLCIAVLFSLFCSCRETVSGQFDRSTPAYQDDLIISTGKQRGMHLFGRLDSASAVPLKRLNCNYITLVAYADQAKHNSDELTYFGRDTLDRKRRDSSWTAHIDRAHALGFKVFVKPHVWMYDDEYGKWRSDIFPDDEEAWKSWSGHYRNFILQYAEIAQAAGAEMFCVGTELSRLAIEKSDFWKSLIAEVRSVYSGKLTYAANWYEEFEAISFWSDLDYIGIQAYFPVTKNHNPEVKDVRKSWIRYKDVMKKMSMAFKRPVLFTEIGYKSTTDAGITPWEWIDDIEDGEKQVSFETQSNCYRAFFDAVWQEPWFAGAHLWQWRSHSKRSNFRAELDFSPQGKPAEDVIARGFLR